MFLSIFIILWTKIHEKWRQNHVKWKITFLKYFLGNKQRTLNEKKNAMINFKKWCKGQNLNLDEDLIKDAKALTFRLVQYLESYRVKDKKTGQLIRPKTNTLNKLKSNLKTELAQLSGKSFWNCVFKPFQLLLYFLYVFYRLQSRY